ncbi:hypothetical protein [Rhizobium rhizophilum]|uniref:Secreted protein n=1 Tax=Rhizobium rhizophilum TaxID=1850373 RepID=A0ABY2QSS4_9HYPH|nr:hypothetical protein [Rhizobium rhizophilum]THV12669.1 hypothetical protein E9677_18240 [Rhizobium rhizophilum]
MRTDRLQATMTAYQPASMLLLWQSFCAAELSFEVFMSNFSVSHVLRAYPLGIATIPQCGPVDDRCIRDSDSDCMSEIRAPLDSFRLTTPTGISD